jgi:hypothetical protein
MSLLIDLDTVIRKSAESTIFDIRLAQNGFIVNCFLPDIFDNLFVEGINKPILELRVISEFTFISNHKSDVMYPCFFKLIELKKSLETNQWGFYVPAEEKKKFFSQIKNKYTLAYGKHSAKYSLLFLIEPKILQALICQPSDISCSIIDLDKIDTKSDSLYSE